jgi:hypothetical protein
MEKPVRIIENEKIRTFNDKVKNGLEHALNFMLGTGDDAKVQISHFEPFLMPIESYIGAYKKQSVLIRIYSDQDYPGELYWFFELRTAVILGNLLRMVPISSLEEKLAKGEFDATDQDAFGEVGNQLAGILDRAFRTLTKKNIHLRMDFNKVIYPSESIGVKNFLSQEEYVVLLATVTIPKHGGQKLTLLLPRSMYEVMLNLEVGLQGIEPKNVLVYSADEAIRENIQKELNSRYTKVWVFEQPDDLLPALDKMKISAIGFDFKKLQFPLQLQDQILLKRLAGNRTLSKLPYFFTWEGATEAEIAEVQKFGLNGATSGSFSANFPLWCKSFTQDPTVKSKS